MRTIRRSRSRRRRTMVHDVQEIPGEIDSAASGHDRAAPAAQPAAPAVNAFAAGAAPGAARPPWARRPLRRIPCIHNGSGADAVPGGSHPRKSRLDPDWAAAGLRGPTGQSLRARSRQHSRSRRRSSGSLALESIRGYSRDRSPRRGVCLRETIPLPRAHREPDPPRECSLRAIRLVREPRPALPPFSPPTPSGFFAGPR